MSSIPVVARPAPKQTPLPAKTGVKLRREGWSRRLPFLPAFLVTVALTQLPFVLTLIYSFTNWNLLFPGKRSFIGFDNYTRAFADPVFRQAAVNTVVITATSVIASVLIGLALAMLLDRAFRGRGIARTLLITPFLVMPAAASLIWKTTILNAGGGVLNWVLTPLGGSDIDWAGHHATLTVIFVLVWQWTPFMMLILLAGLQSQPGEVLEAARVDGAKGWQIFQYMTFPHLRQYFELGIVLGAIYILQAFDQVYLITQGGPGTQTTILPYFLYLRTFRGGQIGFAAAAGVIVVIATIIIATFALRLVASMFRQEPNR